MNFFTFYKDIVTKENFFMTFQLVHILVLGIIFISIKLLLKNYQKRDELGKQRFQVAMAMYFFVEELLYSIWLVSACHDHLWQELIPLQLCSICVYVSIGAVYFKQDTLRFFSAIVGTMAGLVAICYPANISGLYPAFSYRTINFFMLHGAFILFGCIQLQDKELLQYRNIKRCTCLLSLMVVTAFIVNLLFHTDYMFIGVPSSIGFIRSVYQATGIALFIPVVIIILTTIQTIVVWALKHWMKRHDHAFQEDAPMTYK